ncbi:MAG: hypothetical protein KC502_05405 [Myxococcales bacterium]|nr:hypothetical protein [Myxococcales bacterium]
MPPLPPQSSDRSSTTAPTLTVAILGGLLLGLPAWSLQTWPLAWLGIGASAWALAKEPVWHRAMLGVLAGGVVTRVLWLAWSLPMARAMIPDDPGMQAIVTVGFVAIETVPVVGLLCVGAAALHRLRGTVCIWLPALWVVGERLQAQWTSVATDWLYTQLEFPPIMEALRTFGLVPATLACLFVAAAVGQAWALRQKWLLIPVGVVLVALAAAPPLPPGSADELAGIGAVHLRSETALPTVDAIDSDLDLVVWPEASFAAEPTVQEGSGAGLRLDAAPGGQRAQHLVGVRTPPRYGRQNMALLVEPDGLISQARAKIALFPLFERPFLGFGGPGLVPGERVPLFQVGERQVITLICGEFLDRELVARGVAAGGKLLAVMARDRYQGDSTQADRHTLIMLRLRAIEFGVPAVYASLEGRASFVSATGAVLARSAADANSGVLTYHPDRGAQDRRPPRDPVVTVLYSKATPKLRPDCMPGRCTFLPIEGLTCPQAPTRTVVVSGHSDGTLVAGLAPEALAKLVSCFKPELVVLDACYGAAQPILDALATPTKRLVVAVPANLAARGLRYGRAFYGDGPVAERAAAIQTWPPSPLYVGRPDRAALAAATSWVERASGDTLRPLVRSWVPTLVAKPLPGGDVLFPADWRKIGHPPSP